MSREALLAPNDHAGALVPEVRRLCPFLTRRAARRVAELAVAMREAALNDGAAQVAHLRQAGFGTREIGLAWPLAQAVLRRQDEPEAEPLAFTAADRGHLAAFNARYLAAERGAPLALAA